MGLKLKHYLRKHMPVTAARILWLASRLVRTRIVGFDQVQRLHQVNFAHWHGDELALLPWFGKTNAALLVSHSKDGEMMAAGARHLGYHVVRGSSTRGAVGGMLALLKASRQGHHAVLAVDGPQGPRFVCKPGIVRLTQKSGVPLLPVGVAVTRRYTFAKSWNKAYLPLPFACQVLYFSEPLYLGPEKSGAAMDAYCRTVEDALRTAHRNAQESLLRW
jgi:lysophospholipid acyltransferase (LPLAT)-like uncharacterized protein